MRIRQKDGMFVRPIHELIDAVRTGLLAAGLFALTASAVSAGENTKNVVLELFTSQGCSSCPAADSLLGEFAKRDNVIALSFHVDYWDYIGWKDTFASKETTDRQKAYGRALNHKYVYTPEIVVGGPRHMTGSDSRGIERAIKAALAGQPDAAQIEIAKTGGELEVRLAPGPIKGADVWLFDIDRKHTVAVERGENTGRKLSYHHVVRRIEHLGRCSGQAEAFKLDAARAQKAGRDGLVVVVQPPGQGPVLGAAKVWF